MIAVTPPLTPLLSRVEKPGRYIGGELNAIVKDLSQQELVWAFAFPDAYDIGMNNLGLQILYHVLNQQPNIACERVFAPWVDMEAEMRSRGIPLFTLENRALVRTCDIFAFTIPYEIILTNVVNMIDLAGLPLRASERDARYPLVIGGGAIAMNPEPIADFFDLFVVGEGEEIVLDISREVIAWKQAGSGDKLLLLKALSRLEGVYVPAFFEPEYADDGRLAAIHPRVPGYKRTLRRIVADFDAAPFPTAPVVPTIQTIHDRLAVEITRGCTAGCRFCQAGMITRPTREKSPETILNLVEASLQNTGYDKVSLNSLSSGDYSCINSLLKLVNDRYGDSMVSTAVPSLRVKTLSPEVAQAVATVTKGGFTIAPEAGSQRMRDAINKDVTDDELVRTVETIFQNGGQSVKLYFMCGLPGETDADLDGIIHMGILAWKTARRFHKSPGVTLNVSSFVPKVFTPYQWAPQVDRHETLRKQRYLREKVRPYRGITLRTHYDYSTMLEGIFSRGDRRLSRLLEVAQRLGCRFDGWQEHISQERWEQAYVEAGIDPTFYLRERALDEVLPWDHIEARVSKKFLKGEWQRHLDALYIPDCRWGDCAPCGSCHREVKITTFDGQDPRQTLELKPPGEGRTYRHPVARIPETQDVPAPVSDPNSPNPPTESRVARLAKLPWRLVRFRFEKVGVGRFVGHLEQHQIFVRALRRLGIQVRYSQGFHPMPRLVFSNPLPVGVESRDEYVEMELVEVDGPIDAALLLQRLNDRQLPEGIHLLEVVDTSQPLFTIGRVAYEATLPNDIPLALVESRIAALLERESIPFQKKKQVLDVRPLIRSLSLQNDTVVFELDTPHTGTIKPFELLQLILPELNPADVSITKTGSSFVPRPIAPAPAHLELPVDASTESPLDADPAGSGGDAASTEDDAAA